MENKDLKAKINKFNNMYYVSSITNNVTLERLHMKLHMSELEELKKVVNGNTINGSTVYSIYDALQMQDDPVENYYDIAESIMGIYSIDDDSMVLELNTGSDLLDFINNLEI